MVHLCEDDRLTSLVESFESSSPFDMSCTPIQIIPLRARIKVTEQDYFAELDRLEQQGWEGLVEAFDELPIGVS